MKKKTKSVQDQNDKRGAAITATPNGKNRIIPGVYANSKKKALVLGAVKGRVLYSCDDAGAQTIRLATCSAKNFINSAGMKLIRPFTAAEVASMLSRAVSLRPKRLSSKFEKWLFFDEKRMAGLIELIGRTEPQPEVCTGDTEPESSNIPLTSTWFVRWFMWCMGVINKVFGRKQASVVPGGYSAVN